VALRNVSIAATWAAMVMVVAASDITLTIDNCTLASSGAYGLLFMDAMTNVSVALSHVWLSGQKVIAADQAASRFVGSNISIADSILVGNTGIIFAAACAFTDSSVSIVDTTITAVTYRGLDLLNLFLRSPITLTRVAVTSADQAVHLNSLTESPVTAQECSVAAGTYGFSVEVSSNSPLTLTDTTVSGGTGVYLKTFTLGSDVVLRNVSIAATSTAMLMRVAASDITITVDNCTLASSGVYGFLFMDAMTNVSVALSHVLLSGQKTFAADSLTATFTDSRVNVTDSVLVGSSFGVELLGALLRSAVSLRRVTCDTAGAGMSAFGTASTLTLDGVRITGPAVDGVRLGALDNVGVAITGGNVWAATQYGVTMAGAATAGTSVVVRDLLVTGGAATSLDLSQSWTDSAVTACAFRPKVTTIGATTNTSVNILTRVCNTASSSVSPSASLPPTATVSRSATGTPPPTVTQTHTATAIATATVATAAAITAAATTAVLPTASSPLPTATPTTAAAPALTPSPNGANANEAASSSSTAQSASAAECLVGDLPCLVFILAVTACVFLAVGTIASALLRRDRRKPTPQSTSVQSAQAGNEISSPSPAVSHAATLESQA
jgi:hypothetical protein